MEREGVRKQLVIKERKEGGDMGKGHGNREGKVGSYSKSHGKEKRNSN